MKTQVFLCLEISVALRPDDMAACWLLSPHGLKSSGPDSMELSLVKTTASRVYLQEHARL